jgi:hypothetical protein
VPDVEGGLYLNLLSRKVFSTICLALISTSFISICQNTSNSGYGVTSFSGDGVLKTSFSWEGYGGYVASGVGTWGSTSGNIAIQNIPSGATIEKAYIYWLCWANYGLDSFIYVNGQDLTGTQIGHEGSWYSLRANITSLVTGNGDYKITDITYAYGVSIVVIYSYPSSNYVKIIINDGMDTDYNNIVYPHWLTDTIFSGFIASPNPLATVTYILGDGQTYYQGAWRHDKYSFNGNIIAEDHGDGSDGNPTTHGWDTDTYDISSHVLQGDITATANLYEDNDELFWVVCVFSVTLAPPILRPIANAGEDLLVNEGEIVQFNGSTSYDPDGNITKYEWDFDADVDSDGDGNSTNDVDVKGPTPTHIYGDNGVFIVTLKVTDDQNLTDTNTCNITVLNVAPIIDPIQEYTINEYESMTLIGHAIDPGSDDLTFTWNWGYTPWSDKTTVYYNDGLNPDPYPSPTINPRNITENATCQYGDNGVFTVTLTVSDDDGGSTMISTNITVNNVAPTVSIESATMNVEISLRVAGSKWSNVGLTLYENDTEIGYIEVERWPGSPDDNPTYENPALPTTLDMTKSYKAIVTYDPYPDNNDEIKGDQPNNGKDRQNNAGNPVWIIMKFNDGSEEKIHHIFNTQQSKKRNSEHWNHVEPWEVDLNGHLVGHEFEVTSHITDPGSDDETLTYAYGSQVVTFTYLNNPAVSDPCPSPEVNARDIMDTTTFTYEGQGTISLLVEDDDDGTTTTSFALG